MPLKIRATSSARKPSVAPRSAVSAGKRVAQNQKKTRPATSAKALKKNRRNTASSAPSCKSGGTCRRSTALSSSSPNPAAIWRPALFSILPGCTACLRSRTRLHRLLSPPRHPSMKPRLPSQPSRSIGSKHFCKASASIPCRTRSPNPTLPPEWLRGAWPPCKMIGGVSASAAGSAEEHPD
jgi:hypothetical protein